LAEADMVGISMLDRTLPAAQRHTFVEKLKWVRAAAGERYPEIELQAMVADVEVNASVSVAVERVASRRAIAPAEVLASPAALAGDTAAIVDQLTAWREQSDPSYFIFRHAHIDDIAPVVAKLAGT
jgi:hypothetical protein